MVKVYNTFINGSPYWMVSHFQGLAELRIVAFTKWKSVDLKQKGYKHYPYITTLCVVNATKHQYWNFHNTLFTYSAQETNIYNFLRSECVIDKNIRYIENIKIIPSVFDIFPAYTGVYRASTKNEE